VRLIRPDGQILFKDVTPTRHLSNHWTAGASMAWYPAFLAGDVLARIVDAPRKGFSTPYVASVAITSALAGLLTLLIGRQIAAQATRRTQLATVAAIAIWLGSPLAYYALRAPTMSHAISALACAAVVWISLRLRDHADNATFFALGMAIGFACAVRPQNVPIAIVPLMLVPRLLRHAHLVLGGALLAALPQLIVSQTLWGAPLAFVNIGGRAHPWQMFATFRPFETLFSWYHGFVPWTPLLAVALIGLVMLRREDRAFANAGLALFVAQWLVLSILERWFWGGASFGQRRFDSCTVFFIVGLAAFLARVPRWLGALVTIACSAWTMMLFIAASQLNLNRYQTLSEVLDAFRAAFTAAQWRTPLGFTPPQMRADVTIAAMVATLFVALVLLIARRAPVSIAAAYLVLLAALYAWCGTHPKYDALSRALIARPMRSGSAMDTAALLEYEADYMERTGRPEAAARARAEAAAMLR
jgi:hypothetical protein